MVCTHGVHGGAQRSPRITLCSSQRRCQEFGAGRHLAMRDNAHHESGRASGPCAICALSTTRPSAVPRLECISPQGLACLPSGNRDALRACGRHSTYRHLRSPCATKCLRRISEWYMQHRGHSHAHSGSASACNLTKTAPWMRSCVQYSPPTAACNAEAAAKRSSSASTAAWNAARRSPWELACNNCCARSAAASSGAAISASAALRNSAACAAVTPAPGAKAARAARSCRWRSATERRSQ
mmetsp:Transcript_45970/g.127624  ORF Transcript_45970/g.127624 Transcript_45970/m.127624 type:complete len:241 (+) Transcript_45970:56-778(+)